MSFTRMTPRLTGSGRVERISGALVKDKQGDVTHVHKAQSARTLEYREYCPLCKTMRTVGFRPWASHIPYCDKCGSITRTKRNR